MPRCRRSRTGRGERKGKRHIPEPMLSPTWAENESSDPSRWKHAWHRGWANYPPQSPMRHPRDLHQRITSAMSINSSGERLAFHLSFLRQQCVGEPSNLRAKPSHIVGGLFDSRLHSKRMEDGNERALAGDGWEYRTISRRYQVQESKTMRTDTSLEQRCNDGRTKLGHRPSTLGPVAPV